MHHDHAVSDRPTTDAARRAALLAALDVVDGGAEERFDRITRIAREAFGVSGSFPQPRGDRHDHDQVAAERDRVRSDDPAARHVLRPDARRRRTGRCPRRARRRPLLRHADGRRRPERPVLRRVPLRVGDDDVKVGTLCLIDPTPRTLEPDDLALLEELGVWAERELSAAPTRTGSARCSPDSSRPRFAVPGYRSAGCPFRTESSRVTSTTGTSTATRSSSPWPT